MPRVLISAGHTSSDPGAVYQDLREADYTRKIAQKVIPFLEEAGIEVQGVPLDMPLLQRIQWINNTGYSDAAGDICIEIHINDGGKRGLESWFKGEGNNNSQKLAKVLVETIAEETGYENQGFKSEFQHELGSLTFLNRTSPATVILETLFIDNPDDIAELKDESKLNLLAQAIASAILKFFGKDEDGSELPEEKKPNYDNLQTVPHPLRARTPRVSAPAAGFTPNFGGSALGQPIPSMSGMATSRNSGGAGFMMDREQRKSMVEKSYLQILGRKPKQAELNYFLNQGISESDLIKKMAESQEHQDILKSTLELKEKKTELDKLSRENMGMKAMVREQKALIENLNRLISHKNDALSKAQQTPGEILQNITNNDAPPPSQVEVKVNKSLAERVYGFLIRRFG